MNSLNGHNGSYPLNNTIQFDHSVQTLHTHTHTHTHTHRQYYKLLVRNDDLWVGSQQVGGQILYEL